MKLLLLILLFLTFAFNCVAQPEKAYWYFGNKAGIRFQDDTVIALTDGQMEAWEGCATISDRQGQLLFYSNGVQVFGRDHRVLPNGSGLLGNLSSTQSALFVPHPSDRNLYYLFTTGASEQGDEAVMAYSIIDRRLNNGIGDITVKNQVLMQPTTEKLCGIRHANGRDVWVIGHKMNSNDFYVYLVTNTGVNTVPIVSRTGTIHNINQNSFPYDNAIGAMKSSTDGKTLALTITFKKVIEIFNFNSNNGDIVYNNTITSMFGYPYGLEFSSQNDFLYIGSSDNNPHDPPFASKIYEFNLSNSIHTLSNTRLLKSTESSNDYFLALQLSPNNKIFQSINRTNYLGSINTSGISSFYLDSTINLLDRTCELGLPNFINDFPSIIKHSASCINRDVLFSVRETIENDSVKWLIKDAANTLLTSTTQQSFTYTFPRIGNYKALLVYYQNGEPDTSLQTITIRNLPTVNLGTDTLLYEGETLSLNITQPGASYLWQDGSTTPGYAITTPGTYTVQLTDKYGCTTSDTLNVRFTTIRIPNVFTPNGDGVNDVFVVEGIELHTWHMSIYNRFGKQVFSSEHYANNWIGKDTDAGIYYYNINNQRLKKHFKGWLEILK